MSGNFGSSDQILDGGTQGLSFFSQFIPVYEEAAQLAGRGRNRGISYDRDIKAPYDEQRGIDFSMLRADADHLRTAITNAENHLHNLDRYWGGLSGWTGAAANSARQFHDRFNSTTVNFVEAVRNCPGAITGAVTAIEDTLSRYVERVQDLQDQRCGGMTVSEVRSAIATARGDIEGADAARFLGKVVDASSGIVTFGAGWLLAYFGYGASAQIDRCCQELMAAAKRALGDFIDEFDAKKAAFDAYTQNSQRRVQLNYDTMLNNLRPMSAEAFKDLPDPTPFSQTQTTPQGQTGGRRTPTPTVGNGQTRPGSTVPQSGSRPTQPPQLPGTTTPAGSPPTLPTGTTPTTPPIAPPTPTPTPPPLPTPPVTQPQQPQTVTIRNGASTITLSSPDSQGHVKLTVGDGTTPPKTYDVDFARLTNPSSLTGPSGAGPIPPLTPSIGSPSGGHPATPGAIPMPPISGIGGSTGSGGGSPATPRLPSTLFPFTDKPAAPTHPDEDGKVVIHDGEVTITVEPDELTDQLKIQLDDGHGHTTSYRVDYHDPAHPTLVQDPNQEPFRFGPAGEKPSFLSVAPDPLSTGDSFHPSGAGMPAGVGVSAALSGAGGGGIGALSGAAHGPSGQLEPGAYSQVGGPAAGQTTPSGATGPAASAPQQGGAPMGGGMPMGGMGAMQGGQDKERGGNRWLAKGNVIEDEGESKRRAVKSGGVIGEDKKK
jgi:hypothetical protein